MNKRMTYKREWLNPPTSSDSGAISYCYGHDYNYYQSDMTIWDCSRKITLDFGFTLGKRKEQSARIKKINILIKALIEMRDAMVNADKKENTGG